MSSPGGDEVGRVSVRVLPDTSGFKRELEAALKNLPDIELDIDCDDLHRKIQDCLDDAKATIKVNFDVERLQDDIDRATAGARADDVKVPVHVDDDALARELADIGDQIDPVNIPVGLNQADLEASIQEIMARLHELDAEEASPEVILESTEWKEQLRELKAQLAALSAEEIDIKVTDSGINEVLGNVSKVKLDLETLAKDPVAFKLTLEEQDLQEDLARILAELESLDGKTATPEVDAQVAEALADLAKVLTAMEALDSKRTKLGVEVDADTAGAAAQIDAFVARQRLRNKITLNVDIDRSQVAVATGALRGLFSGLAGAFRSVGDGVNGIVFGVTRVQGALTSSEDAAAGFASKLGAVGSVAAQLAGPLLYASAIAAGLTVLGAAITAAWGAAATAISAVPAAIALIGVPAAAVMLGLDGIKKAAATIKPEFDALKASVSATFEKGLTPAFQLLGEAIPKVRDGINQVASAVSVTGTNFAVMLTSAQGIDALNGIFAKVSQSLLGMQTGIQDITLTFLELANQKAVFDLLTTAVNDFGAAFKAAVTDSLASGDFQAAMQGLTGTLGALSRGFTDLVNNGLTVFANAAPGVNHMIDSLTGFFNRFDWASLGRSVGAVFDGLASAIDRIPQGTIDGIAAGFQRIGETFQQAGFQQALIDVANTLPQLLGFIQGSIEGLARLGQAFVGAFHMVSAFVDNFGVVWDLLEGEITWDEAGRRIHEGQAVFEQGFGEILSSVQEWGPQVSTAAGSSLSGVPGAVGTALAPVPGAAAAALAPMVPAVQAELAKLNTGAIAPSLHNADLAIEQGVKNWEATARAGAAGVPPAVGTELGKVPPAADTALAPLQQLEALKGMKDQFTLAAADSMHAMSVGVQSGMAEVQQQFTAGMDTVSSGTNTSFGLISQGFTIGMAGLASTVTAGMPAIQAAFNFENIGTQVGLAFLGMVGTFNLGMASLAGAVTAGMPAIQAAFNFTNIGLGVGQAFLGLVGTVTLGMQSIAATVTANMALVNAAFNFTNIGLTVGQAFLGLVGSVTLGMASIVVAVQTGMVQVLAAFNFTNVGLGVGLAFQGLVGTVTLGMASLAATVTAGMPAIAAAFNLQALATTVGLTFQGLVGTFTLGMASIAAAVTTGMAQASAAMSAGMAGMAAAASAGMAGVTAAVQAGMAQAVSAVVAAGAQIGAAAQASMAGFGNSIRAGMAAATAAVAAGTAQMIAQFTQLAQQIVVTATTSMAAFGNAVRAGMSLATAAVAAGVAAMVSALRAGAGQFNAVGVQMMNGLRAGILSQASSIAAAAAQVVRGAVAAARAAAAVQSPSRLFMEIGSFMGEGMAIGIEGSATRVATAAADMVDSAVGAADKIADAFAGDKWASDFSAKVEQSFGDLDPTVSNKDVVGAIKRQSGDLDSSSQLSAMIAILGAMLTELRGGGSNAAAGAQGSRRAAELGAF